MVAGVGAAFGYRSGVRYILGLCLGTNLVALAVVTGLATIVLSNYGLRVILMVCSSSYLLFLAYKIAMRGAEISFSKSEQKPGILAGVLLQLVNPKAWTISTMVASGFLPKDERLIISILFISITALIICPLSISVWAAFGSGIRNLVKNNKKKAIVEYFLAILLLVTAIMIVIEK